ncbi:MAG: tRNA (adenosine(37)-N6)-dimethylallyltransferase MiaA [Lachnospiraceae bacterium]|nr:tRNA (adenosine(37)-N6)-dimethylallyltransferase MiaA [Lachnospiraceae bacterium]
MAISDPKRPLVIIGGPTGSGKSGAAVKLAGMIDGEIISADSVAIYKYLDIGSAKPTNKEMDGIKHHLISVLEPDEYFGVDRFVSMAMEAVNDIYSRNKTPILVGGTHFYVQAFLYGVDFDSEGEHDDSFRTEAAKKASNEAGLFALYEELKEKDPEYAATVHPNNVKRVIRALEYIHYCGEKFSEYNAAQAARKSDFTFLYTALNMDRDLLYKRIDNRVDMMIKSGLESEVRSILSMGYDKSLNSLSSIGYKEMIAHIDGRCDLDTAIDDIKKNTRHFAKRQLTWLKRERDVQILDIDGLDSANIAERIYKDIPWIN